MARRDNARLVFSTNVRVPGEYLPAIRTIAEEDGLLQRELLKIILVCRAERLGIATTVDTTDLRAPLQEIANLTGRSMLAEIAFATDEYLRGRGLRPVRPLHATAQRWAA